jgi:multicomponent Na+:H+ antiporter subunit B
MKLAAFGLMIFAAGVLFAASGALPVFGDPASPASTHVSPRYIERGRAETGAANLVTGVLADYRGYDTLGETVVIFTAGLACLLIVGLGAGWSFTRGER